jgi:tetratricopeptide (TPR) repeat protein
MVDKKHKSRDEWKKVVHDSLTPEQFQDLCYDLIKRNGFRNVQPRGKGSDGGRDLEGEWAYSIAGKEEIIDECWFQCKRLKEGLNFKEISTEIQKAEDQNIRRFFVLSISDTTAPCKDDIKNWNIKHKCEIIDWSGSKFLDILFGEPDICKFYFPDEEVNPLIDSKNPKQAISLSSDLGKRYGIEIQFDIPKKINLSNPQEIADILKDALIKIEKIDINIKSLVYEKISMFFFSIDRSEDALMFLNQSLDITPKNVGSLLNKVYILEKIDRVKESTACYDQILKIDSKNKFALNNKAHNLMRLGEFEDALKFINAALETDSDFIIAINNKAEILKSLKKSREAIQYLEEKKELVEKSLNLQSTKAGLCIELLDLKEAYKINEEILRKNPNLADAINNKGVIYEKNSRFQKKEKYLPLALEWFEKVIKTDNAYPLGWSNKAAVYIGLGNVEEAKKIIDDAAYLFPKDPYILNKMGNILLGNNPKEAVKYFDKALNLKFDENFLLNKAQAQINLSQWKEAKENAERVLKFNSEKSDAWLVKGQALRRLHQPAKAEICFKNAEKYKEKAISLLE